MRLALNDESVETGELKHLAVGRSDNLNMNLVEREQPSTGPPVHATGDSR